MNINKKQKTSSFCGTSMYLAPEMLKRKSYGFKIDWYAIGLITLELLTGDNPFYDRTQQGIFDKILNQKLKKEKYISNDAWDFINQLMEKDENKRAGVNIKAHKWLKDIDWKILSNKGLETENNIIPIGELTDRQNQNSKIDLDAVRNQQILQIKNNNGIQNAGCNQQKKEKTNQDTAIVNPKNLADLDIHLFAICDGHGQNGHQISQLIQKNFPLNIQKYLSNDFKQTILQSYKETNKQIFAQSVDSYLSGSTLISIFIQKKKLYIANVGDSRVILAKQKASNTPFYPCQLSTDHKPSLESEKNRIIKAGGRVESQAHYNGQPVGPLRVWQQNADIPGLAMTRSMGDRAGIPAGITADPEINEIQLTAEDKFIVIASDGIWDFMNDFDVVKCVEQFYDKKNADQAAECLINQAIQAWKKETDYRDDITCTVIFLEN
ncbi:protein phosphatase 2c, putative [Ichthyophthirius multifiliis]|uniref:Protein phosphatase 2c, putative n=1 Tax=Ichthyophthirius multifiliis TaxID=5932 RepID=G0QY79_ICHMU|nr:protein phosphatase 2c, putative [Ichthyophthirius multifiliis]EGR29818.1 protein phosphatase 2c, putative [Ichthyophthirius multifiliis]|eukprot:XP_004031054.1 protein phosphatase 2c, putative [Ichthyophthirius multifiliis]